MAVRVRRSLARYSTCEDIPSALFSGAKIRGRVAKVSDGDTFRMYHTPIFGSPLDGASGKLSEHTLHVRLAAVDAPETAKFGAQGMPFAIEAKDELTRLLPEGIDVTVKLLHKDQYGRAVGQVYAGRWPFRTDASAAVLEKGFGSIYRKQGAVYGDDLARYEQAEADAQAREVGIWSLGPNRETPAEYKRRTKA